MATNKKFNSKLFAREIISFRESNNFTVRNFADIADVSVKTVFNAESENSQTMAIENIVKIANAIKQPISKYL